MIISNCFLTNEFLLFEIVFSSFHFCLVPCVFFWNIFSPVITFVNQGSVILPVLSNLGWDVVKMYEWTRRFHYKWHVVKDNHHRKAFKYHILKLLKQIKNSYSTNNSLFFFVLSVYILHMKVMQVTINWFSCFLGFFSICRNLTYLTQATHLQRAVG